MKEYFISDTHFGHRNMCGENSIVPTRKRFKDTDEMDVYLVQNWNLQVNKTDTVYFLGDFSMNAKPQRIVDLLKALQGNIVFVKGNHDASKLKTLIARTPELNSRIEWHDLGLIIKREKKIIHLTHYPLIIGERGNRVNLHGHIHEYARVEPNLLNVGIDSPELGNHPFGAPISLEQALALLEAKRTNFKADGLEMDLHGIIK